MTMAVFMAVSYPRRTTKIQVASCGALHSGHPLSTLLRLTLTSLLVNTPEIFTTLLTAVHLSSLSSLILVLTQHRMYYQSESFRELSAFHEGTKWLFDRPETYTGACAS